MPSNASELGWTPEGIRLSIQVAEARGWRITLNELGSHVMGVPPGGGEPRPIPNFAGWGESCWVLFEELVAELPDYRDLFIGRGGPQADIIHVDLPSGGYAEGMTLTEAIARIWLAWKGMEK